MNDVRIRAATLAEAETIARVHVQAWSESYRGLVPDHVIEALSVECNTLMWGTILGSEAMDVHLVEHGTDAGDTIDIVGFGSAADARGSALGTSGEVTAIYLLDGFKRRGIGRALLTGLLLALADRGHMSAGLWVLLENHGTRRFYEALGGRPGPRRVVTDGPVAMHEIAYVWYDLSDFAACRP